jgi:hypothetical protein
VRDAVGRGDLEARRVADYVMLRRAVQLSAR